MKSKLCNSAIKRSTFVHKQTQDSANPFGQLLQYDVGCVGTIYSSQEPITRSEQLPCAHVTAFLRTSLSRSSERILIWYSCGIRAEIFELSRATADQPPLLILSGPISVARRKLDSFGRAGVGLVFVIQSRFRADVMLVDYDEHGSIKDDYYQFLERFWQELVNMF